MFYQKVLAVLSVIVGDVPITAVHVGQLHSEHVVAIGLVSAAHALVVKRGPGVVLCSAPSVSQPVFTITEKAPSRAFSWLKAAIIIRDGRL